MNKFTINYSTKNIPIPSRKLYVKTLTDKVEKVIKRMRWKAFFFDKDDQNDPDDEELETFGFKSRKCPPQHPDLQAFERDLLQMIQQISFRPFRNEFQDKLRNDINKIRSSDKAFIPADKSRNYYEMDKSEHDKLYTENITKTYKKLRDETVYKDINKEAKTFTDNLRLSDKVECLAESNAFITLKDHKENFINNPQCRLINPAKPELGKISKFVIERVNKVVKEESNVNQWHSTDDVIHWFRKIKNKKKCIFVQFDIVEFYPSISKELLEAALSHAGRYIELTDDEKSIIMHSRKSLLFANNGHWVKKIGDPNFDVTMGSFDGAELCELVGLFILFRLGQKFGLKRSGLYRDDGLSCFELDGHDADAIRKHIIQMFNEEFKLKITILTNLKVVNFLDVTFNLKYGTFEPYSKPNSQPTYVNVDSNHPPNVIKRIPAMISDRINKISSNKSIFKRASTFYNDALKNSGYKSKLEYKNKTDNKKQTRKNRPRKIIWFNPPFSLSVNTDVAKRFLKIVNKNFPKKHRLHKLFNRNNLKVSYSCLPNVSSIIASHNRKILNDETSSDTNHKMCNCRVKNECPLEGKCLEKQLIYQCTVKSSENDVGVNYIGLTENAFKTRWSQHKHTFKYEEKANSTELSKYVWGLQRKNITPILSWKVIDHARPYTKGSKSCNLCLTEKYHIITSKDNIINKRTELISTCRHMNKFLLKNLKEVPPDP